MQRAQITKGFIHNGVLYFFVISLAFCFLDMRLSFLELATT